MFSKIRGELKDLPMTDEMEGRVLVQLPTSKIVQVVDAVVPHHLTKRLSRELCEYRVGLSRRGHSDGLPLCMVSRTVGVSASRFVESRTLAGQTGLIGVIGRSVIPIRKCSRWVGRRERRIAGRTGILLGEVRKLPRIDTTTRQLTNLVVAEASKVDGL